jgi:hypothetical protein
VLFYDYETRRRFASERVADLAQEARSVRASAPDGDVCRRDSIITRLLQAWQSRRHAPSACLPRVTRTATATPTATPAAERH